MKKTLITLVAAAILIMIGSSAVMAEEIPSLVGHWHGISQMHGAVLEHQEGTVPLKLVVEEQNGRVFSGKKIWVARGVEYTEKFSGVVAVTNDKFYMAEHIDGMIAGDIISKDKIAIYYLEEGNTAKVIFTELKRVSE